MNLENEEKNILENKTSKKVKVNNYFDTREEEAVKKYITASSSRVSK